MTHTHTRFTSEGGPETRLQFGVLFKDTSATCDPPSHEMINVSRGSSTQLMTASRWHSTHKTHTHTHTHTQTHLSHTHTVKHGSAGFSSGEWISTFLHVVQILMILWPLRHLNYKLFTFLITSWIGSYFFALKTIQHVFWSCSVFFPSFSAEAGFSSSQEVKTNKLFLTTCRQSLFLNNLPM